MYLYTEWWHDISRYECEGHLHISPKFNDIILLMHSTISQAFHICKSVIEVKTNEINICLPLKCSYFSQCFLYDNVFKCMSEKEKITNYFSLTCCLSVFVFKQVLLLDFHGRLCDALFLGVPKDYRLHTAEYSFHTV